MPGQVTQANGGRGTIKPRHRPRGRGRDRRDHDRRALPRGGPPREARYRTCERALPGDGLPERRGPGRELGLSSAPRPRSSSGSRVTCSMTVLVPNASTRPSERGCPAEAPRFGSAGRPSTCTWCASPRLAGRGRRAGRQRGPVARTNEGVRRQCRRCSASGTGTSGSSGVGAFIAGGSRSRRWPSAPASASRHAAAAAGSRAVAAAGACRRSRSTGKPTGELTISNWPLYIDKQTFRDFEEATGRHGQVHRGRQRQRRVLRQGAAAARPGRVRAAARSSSSPTGWRTRCTSSATCRTSTSRRCPTSRRTSSRPAAPDLRPQPRLLGAVADAG